MRFALFVALVALAVAQENPDAEKSYPLIFEPEDDWKEIMPNQQLPGGLDIRMDLSTGKKHARNIPASERVGIQPASRTAGSVVAAVSEVMALADLAHPVDKQVLVSETPTTAEESSAPEDPLSHLDAPSRKMHEILMSLPMPDAELAEAAHAGLSPDELSATLARVWNRRQVELQNFMRAARTEAQQMHALLGELAAPGQQQLGAPSSSAAASSIEARLAVLEDLEMHVAQVHNAEDFATMGGIGDMVQLLRLEPRGAGEAGEGEEDRLVAHAAWVLGTACKYAPSPQAEALAQGAPVALARVLGRVSSALTSAAASAAASLDRHSEEEGETEKQQLQRGGDRDTEEGETEEQQWLHGLLSLGAKAVYAAGGLSRGSSQGTLALINASAYAHIAAIVRATAVLLDAAVAVRDSSGEPMGQIRGPVAARALCSKSLTLLADLALEAAEQPLSPAAADSATGDALVGADGVKVTVLNSQALLPAAASATLQPAEHGAAASKSRVLAQLCAVAEAAWPTLRTDGAVLVGATMPCRSPLAGGKSPLPLETVLRVDLSVSRAVTDSTAVLHAACKSVGWT